MMFFKRNKGGVGWRWPAWATPGKKYGGTRPIIGFDALDHAAEKWDMPGAQKPV